MSRVSLSDRALGFVVVNCEGAPAFVQQYVPRAMAIIMPLLHLLDVLYYCGMYVTSTISNRVCKQMSSDDPQVTRYCKLAEQHLGAVFSSLPSTIDDPKKGLCLFEQKMEMPERGVTFRLFPGSRLGDNLYCYFNAKWIAHKYNLPIIFKPFPHANELHLSTIQTCVLPEDMRCMPIGEKFSYEEFEKRKDENIIWEVPFFAFFDAKINWADEQFRASILEDLQPLNTQHIPPLAKARKNVALHVRTGGSFDSPYETYYNPTKIPPREFFDEALLIALKEWKNEPMHIQIFTDSTTPAAELQRFKEFAEKHHPNVTVACHACDANNTDTENSTIQDMIAMSHYDGLIRADSGLSKMSSLIGQPVLEISPPGAHSYHVKGNKIVLDTIKIVRRDKDDNGQVKKTEMQEEQLGLSFEYPGNLDAFHEYHIRCIGANKVSKA